MTEFKDADLQGAQFHNVDLRGARMREMDLRGASIRGAWLDGLDLDGDFETLTVNGVDVAPLVEAELNRRYPGREKLKPTDADGFRAAWEVIEQAWPPVVEHARRLPPELLHEHVDGEYSFIETLRHLVFATDAWVGRALLGDPNPFDPLDLPHDDMPDLPDVPRDRAARPSLDEMLALRADRMATVSRVFAELTDERLDGMTEPVLEPGYPESESFVVRRCLRAIVNEEWLHHLYAERDLTALDERTQSIQ
jgi:uncharacterized protein YjbI with pentapeptide repeats